MHMLNSQTKYTGAAHGDATAGWGLRLPRGDSHEHKPAVALMLIPLYQQQLADPSRDLRRDHALFLCYPPPASKMAEEALAAYTGDTVALVGEWDGDTGSQEFTQALLRGWSLQEAIPLPNWSDTAHDLTLWTRRDAILRPDSFAEAAWPVCSASGVFAASLS